MTRDRASHQSGARNQLKPNSMPKDRQTTMPSARDEACYITPAAYKQPKIAVIAGPRGKAASANSRSRLRPARGDQRYLPSMTLTIRSLMSPCSTLRFFSRSEE